MWRIAVVAAVVLLAVYLISDARVVRSIAAL